MAGRLSQVVQLCLMQLTAVMYIQETGYTMKARNSTKMQIPMNSWWKMQSFLNSVHVKSWSKKI